MSKPDPKTQLLDHAKLQTMQEPLAVRVVKMRGNAQTPILIPANDGQNAMGTPGTGWSREGVLRLEDWLSTQWSGGGLYTIAVTDSANVQMTWQASFAHDKYPERNPPTLAELQAAAQRQAGSDPNALAAAQVTPAPQPAAQPPPPVGAYPLGMMGSPLPAGYSSLSAPSFSNVPPPPPAPPATAAQPPTPAWSPAWSTTPPQPPAGQHLIGHNGWGQPVYGFPAAAAVAVPPRAITAVDGFDPEKRRLEEENRRLALESVQREARAEMERERQVAQAQIRELAQQLQALQAKRSSSEDDGERRDREERERRDREDRERRDREEREHRAQLLAAVQAKPAGPSPQDAIAQLKAEMEAARRQDQERFENQRRLDQERADRAAERLEAQRREDALRQEMRDLAAKMEREVRESAANKPNELILFMQENTRQAAETVRLATQQAQAQAAAMQGMMMTPQAVMTMMQSAAGGTDGMIRKVTETYGGIFDLFKNVVGQIAQLQGADAGPSPAVQIAGEALAKAGAIASGWMKVQQQKYATEERTKIATAQAEAIKAQQQTQQIAYAQGYRPNVSQQQQQQQPPQPQPVVAPPPAVAAPTQLEPASPASAAPSMPAPAADAGLSGAAVEEAPDPRDVQSLGIAYEVVQRLRAGCRAFLHATNGNIHLDPLMADGQATGLSPRRAAEQIIEGVSYIVQHNLATQAPAFLLFQQGDLGAFLEALIPEGKTEPKISHAFREACGAAITEILQAAQAPQAAPATAGEVDEADNADEDEESDEGEDEEDGGDEDEDEDEDEEDFEEDHEDDPARAQ